MNQRGGMAAIALLIATVLGVSYFPRKSGDTSGGQETQKSASRIPASSAIGKQQNAAAAKPIPSCEQIAKRLRRVYPPDEKLPMPKSCYPEGTREATAGATATIHDLKLNFAIAIVPNP